MHPGNENMPYFARKIHTKKNQRFVINFKVLSLVKFLLDIPDIFNARSWFISTHVFDGKKARRGP